MDESFTSEACVSLRSIARELDGSSADDGELARSVREVSEGYTRRRDELGSIAGSRRALAARVAFFLPRDAPKIVWPLSELARRDLLPRDRIRVLDLGAGVGATSIGIGRFVRGLAPSVAVTAVDRDGSALAAMTRVVERAPELGSVPIDLETLAADFSSMRLDAEFDLVVFGLSLNEHGSGARAAIDRAAKLCAPGGAIVVIEPALRETTRALMAVRDEIATSGSLHVFAPCVRRGPCPMLAAERDWCHAEIPLALPQPLVAIARGAGLRYERLTFSYLTLRRDRTPLVAGEGAMLGRIVSEPLVSKGKRELVACTEDGPVRIRRLDRRRSDRNAAFDELARGDVLAWTGEADLSAESGRPGSRLAECTQEILIRGFSRGEAGRLGSAMGIAWFDDEPPPATARELRTGGLPLLPPRVEWPACPRCSLPLLFRAQVPLVLTSLAPFDDARLVLVFECHVETDTGACSGGASFVVEGELELRSPPMTPFCDLIIDAPGPTPSRVVEVLRMLEAKTPFEYPFVALRTVPVSIAEQALIAIRDVGGDAHARSAPPTTLASSRGGRLAPFDDGFAGTRRTTLPPLRDLMTEKRMMRGIFGGATPGYRDHALLCSCGGQTRTAFRLLADESGDPALGPAAVQLCPKCSHAELLRMGAARLRPTG